MIEDKASATAQGAALHRAAHQLLDAPLIFADPLALRIIGHEAEEELRAGRSRHTHPRAAPLRAFLVVRSRYAEDCLAEACSRGVDQYVLLGAGLDTSPYRAGGGFRIFEVDHPATQTWKQERLKACGIPVPDRVRFVPTDFERQSLDQTLIDASFDFATPAFIAWLGVVPYLAKDTVFQTLRLLGRRTAPGSELVLDYTEEPESLSDERRRSAEAFAARVAAAGEPFKSSFAAGEMRTLLAEAGWTAVEDLDKMALNGRYLAQRPDGLALRGFARLVRARIAAQGEP